MAEPDFYTIRRSGIRFESGGTLLEQPNGSKLPYYGIGGNHTWDDWGLYCTDVVISAPDAEENTVTIPGRHGIIDHSEILTGMPVYHSRTLSFSFCWLGRMERWHSLYTKILTELHGKIRYITIDTNPGWHYIGRCSVESLRQDGVYSTFEVKVQAEPFQRRNWRTDSQWLWDPFCFETDVIRSASYYSGIEIPAGESRTVTLYNCRKMFSPLIRVSCRLMYYSSGDDWYFTVGNSSNKYTAENMGENKQINIDLSYLSGIHDTENGEMSITITNTSPVVTNHPEYNVLTAAFLYYEGVL